MVERSAEVHTQAGVVRGKIHGEIIDFVGVKYGDRITPDRFSEIGAPCTAQASGTAFPQRPGGLDWVLGPALGELQQSEDSFVLRVQAPAANFEGSAANRPLLPVLVFIPGGGFLSGAAHARWFSHSHLITAGPMILVTVNYRIGALGHFGGAGVPSEASRGLRDLKQAVKWIHKNIAAFGGDPSRVTLSGDSAGAWYTWALSHDRALTGTFARTLLFSLPFEPPLNVDAYEARRAVFQQQLEALGSTIESCPTEDLLTAQSAVSKHFQGRGMAVMPAVFEDELSAEFSQTRSRLGSMHTEAVALFTTSEEAAAFLGPVPESSFTQESSAEYVASRFVAEDTAQQYLLGKRASASTKQRMIDALTLFQFRSFALEVATEVAQQGKQAWVGQLSAQSGLPGIGSPHGFVLPFVFGNRSAWKDAPMLIGVTDDSYALVTDALRQWIVGFVCSGAPEVNGESIAPFSLENPLSLEIDGRNVALCTPDAWGITAIRE